MARKSTQPGAPIHALGLLQDGEPFTVALAGCGGNGSMMLNRLARLDHALRACGRTGLHVFVFDPDEVSITNVGRQSFYMADIGLSKAAVSLNRVNACFGTSWKASPGVYPGRIPSFLGGETASAPDLLITCVDTAKARREIAEQFVNQPHLVPRYWMDLGNERLDGQVVLGQPKECQFNDAACGWQSSAEYLRGGKNDTPFHARLPVVTEVFPEILNARRKESEVPTCSVAEALDRQSLFVNDCMSAFAAQLLDDLFRIGYIRWHGAFINLETGRVNPIPVPAPPAVKLKAAA